MSKHRCGLGELQQSALRRISAHLGLGSAGAQVGERGARRTGSTRTPVRRLPCSLTLGVHEVDVGQSRTL
jgi:hypothetical protein